MNNTRRKQIRSVAERIETAQSDLRTIWLAELESRADEDALDTLDSIVDELGEIVETLKEI